MEWKKKAAQRIISLLGFRAIERSPAPARSFGVLIDYAAIRPNLIQRRTQSLDWLFDPILQNGMVDFGCMFFTQEDLRSSAMRTFSTQEHLFCVCGTSEANSPERKNAKNARTLLSETAVWDDLYNQLSIAADHLMSSVLTDIVIIGRLPHCEMLTERFAREAVWRGKRLIALNADCLDETRMMRSLRATEPQKPALILEISTELRRTALLIDYSNVSKAFTDADSAGLLLKRAAGQDGIAFGCAFVPQNYINAAVLKDTVLRNGLLYICCPIGNRPVNNTNGRHDEGEFRPKDVDTVDAKLRAMARHIIANCPEYTDIVIMSGDGDFVGVCREARWHRKRVVTVGMQGEISPMLRNTADKVLFVAPPEISAAPQ